MWINILRLFNWTTWLLIIFTIIFIFWLVYGGKEEYEFIGIEPLTSIRLAGNEPLPLKHSLFTNPPVEVEVPTFKGNKGEDIVAQAFEEIIEAEIQRNIRPDFLQNPESGKNMELDCYCEKYKIAVEYNGIQHYKYPSAFHKSEREFYNQVYRDRLKKKLCDKAGIYLISVPYWVDQFEDEEQHLNEKYDRYKINNIPRQVRYERIYDYLYDKISEYFQNIFQYNQNGTESDSDRWDSDSDYE